jgi:prophage regulatory protein
MRFLRVREVVPMVGFSKATLYRRIRAGTFPRPIALSLQITAFLDGEVFAWMDAQLTERRSSSKSNMSGRPTSAKAKEGRNV